MQLPIWPLFKSMKFHRSSTSLCVHMLYKLYISVYLSMFSLNNWKGTMMDNQATIGQWPLFLPGILAAFTIYGFAHVGAYGQS